VGRDFLDVQEASGDGDYLERSLPAGDGIGKEKGLEEAQMATRKFEVSWNGEIRTLGLPAERVTAELRFRDLPALADPAGAIIRSLEAPIGALPLHELAKPGDKVAILVGDRMTDWLIGAREHLALPIFDHLNQLGVRDEDITVVYACGMHAHPQAKERMGPELLARVRFVEHDGADDSQQTYIGATHRGTPVWINKAVAEADIKIGIGEISPVGPAGWCGGGKIILPGVVGRDTIEHNHRMCISPDCTHGAIHKNPVRLDIEDAAELAGLDLKVDFLVNSEQRIVAVFCGDFRQEWRAAMPLAKEIWTTPMEPTDITVLYPGDTRERYLGGTVYMGFATAGLMIKPEGAIIITQSAAGGWSADSTLGDMHGPDAEMFAQSSVELAHRMVRAQGNVRSLHIAYMGKKVVEDKPVFLHCDGFTDSEARRLGFAGAFPRLEDALAAATERVGKADATISCGFPRGIQWRMMPRVTD
jgi:lactate racemase